MRFSRDDQSFSCFPYHFLLQEDQLEKILYIIISTEIGSEAQSTAIYFWQFVSC